jgi:DNA polymerase epsilon subunit 4
MEDDEETGPLDMTGSDILPPLAHSTNPLFPNAIVKKPPTNAKYTTKAAKVPVEEKEAKKTAAATHAAPAPPKPYVGKNGPVS